MGIISGFARYLFKRPRDLIKLIEFAGIAYVLSHPEYFSQPFNHWLQKAKANVNTSFEMAIENGLKIAGRELGDIVVEELKAIEEGRYDDEKGLLNDLVSYSIERISERGDEIQPGIVSVLSNYDPKKCYNLGQQFGDLVLRLLSEEQGSGNSSEQFRSFLEGGKDHLTAHWDVYRQRLTDENLYPVKKALEAEFGIKAEWYTVALGKEPMTFEPDLTEEGYYAVGTSAGERLTNAILSGQNFVVGDKGGLTMRGFRDVLRREWPSLGPRLETDVNEAFAGVLKRILPDWKSEYSFALATPGEVGYHIEITEPGLAFLSRKLTRSISQLSSAKSVRMENVRLHFNSGGDFRLLHNETVYGQNAPAVIFDLISNVPETLCDVLFGRSTHYLGTERGN